MAKRNLECRVYNFVTIDGKHRWAYDIVDLDDVIMIHGNELPELIAESAQSWATESSAEKNGKLHLTQLEKCK